ncbi:MAG UNVERIFIED_CONTAM: hypothetical protein LVR18_30605 [Planctomycetaceae bacterium]
MLVLLPPISPVSQRLHVSEQLRPQPPAPAAGFNIVRVLMIVLICGGIGGGAWLLVGELPGLTRQISVQGPGAV